LTFPTRDIQEAHHKTCPECRERIQNNQWLREGWEQWVKDRPELMLASIKKKREAYWEALKKDPERQARDAASKRAGHSKWMKEHPEQVASNMEKARSKAKLSKMEIWLRTSGTLPWGSVQIRCGEDRKQVDFVNPDHTIWVEVDGAFHFIDFQPKKSHKSTLAYTQARDAMLKNEALARGNVTLIRMDSTCFCGRERRLKPEWLEWLTAMLHSPQPGIWCCGKFYESVPWVDATCTILKSPTASTTSSSPTAS
jgi:very-short-patch-repair endonuclease